MGPLVLSLLFAPQVRGVTVAPHFEGERDDARLQRMVDEVAELGASHLQVVVQWEQQTVESTRIEPYRWGTDDAEVSRLVRYAQRKGLTVLVFPIVRLVEQGPGRWRGKLRPASPDAWWASYRRFVLHYARLAADAGAGMLSVGSELGSMEGDEERWRDLVAAARAVFPGELTYSANWDHYPHVGFWDALDYVGLNAYHPITHADRPDGQELEAAWRLVRDKLLVWAALRRRPLLFTEVGYPSRPDGARRPYLHGADGAVDLAAQRDAYRAFCRAWSDERAVAGAFFWIWSGEGGSGDNRYTPRGKPAAEVLRRWFAGEEEAS